MYKCWKKKFNYHQNFLAACKQTCCDVCANISRPNYENSYFIKRKNLQNYGVL